MINITKGSVHEAICNLPDEQKQALAMNCAHYGITPESIENLVTEMLKSIEPFIAFCKNRTVDNLKYWSDNNDKQ